MKTWEVQISWSDNDGGIHTTEARVNFEPDDSILEQLAGLHSESVQIPIKDYISQTIQPPE